MYNENENNNNNNLGRINPEEHKEEPITTNFTMRDADTEETSSRNNSENYEAAGRQETEDGRLGQTEAVTSQGYGQTEAETSQNYGQTGSTTSQNYSQAESTTSQGYGQAEAETSQNYGQTGSATSQNYGQAESAASQNYGQTGSAASQNYGQTGSTASQNYSQTGSTTSQNYGQSGSSASQNYSQPYSQQDGGMRRNMYGQPESGGIRQPYNQAYAQSESGTANHSYSGNQGSNGGYGQPNYQQSAQRGTYGGQQGIPHYQERQYQRMAQGNIKQPEGAKPPKKRGRFVKKAAAVVGAALVFGIVAGGTMVGINWVAGTYNQKMNVEISQAETLPAPTEAASSDSNDAANKAAATATSLDVSAIVDKAMPSVVAITSKVIYESQTWFGPMQREGMGSGSGFVVGKNDSELLIVTNNHVVEGAEELKVTFIDQTAVDAAIKGTDADSDLAVIAVKLSDIPSDTLSQIAIASLGNSDNVKVGQGVVAIGNALGYGQSVTVGYISALDRTVQTEDGVSRDLLQTDAAINPGNSGGALLNMQGEVIGINSAKYSSTEVEGMGYAIPISKAQDIIDTLMTRKTRTQIADSDQGYLGIQCKNIDSMTSQQFGMPQGVFIYKIVEGGAAAQSDLREKDIITKFDGQSVKTYDDLTNMMKYYEGGTTVTLTVQSLENGEYVERNVDVTLGKKPVETNQTSQN